MGKWAKSDLADLENDLWNNSMKSISWQLINTIQKKLYTRNNEKLSHRFWDNWQKKLQKKKQIWPLSDLLDLEKWHSCINREKVIKTVFEKIVYK